MTLCLIDSLIKGLDYEGVMTNFLKWLDEAAYTPHGEVFDVGNTTAKALRRFSRGIPPLGCGGTTERDNGNWLPHEDSPHCILSAVCLRS